MNTDPHGQPIRIDFAAMVTTRTPGTPSPSTHTVYVECVVCARRSESLPVSLTTGVCISCEEIAHRTTEKFTSRNTRIEKENP